MFQLFGLLQCECQNSRNVCLYISCFKSKSVFDSADLLYRLTGEMGLGT